MTEDEGAEREPTEDEIRALETNHRLRPRTIGGAFYLLILALTLVAIAVAAQEDWRIGVRIFAGTLAGAAALRLVLREEDAGMLAVRHRYLDVAMLLVVAAAVWFLAGSIPDQPI